MDWQRVLSCSARVRGYNKTVFPDSTAIIITPRLTITATTCQALFSTLPTHVTSQQVRGEGRTDRRRGSVFFLTAVFCLFQTIMTARGKIFQDFDSNIVIFVLSRTVTIMTHLMLRSGAELDSHNMTAFASSGPEGTHARALDRHSLTKAQVRDAEAALEHARKDHAVATHELASATAAAHQHRKVNARRHNEETCLLFTLLGTDLLQRCLATPCRPRTFLGGKAGLLCKELGRVARVSTQFHSAIVEGAAQMILEERLDTEREWVPHQAGKPWLRTLRELELLTWLPVFSKPIVQRATISAFAGEPAVIDDGMGGLSFSHGGAGCAASNPSTFVCARGPMVAGVHSVQFTVASCDAFKDFTVGIGTQKRTTNTDDQSAEGWGIAGHTGNMHTIADPAAQCEYQAGNCSSINEWSGQQAFEHGDVIGLVLNFRHLQGRHASLTVYKNGVRLGVAAAITASVNARSQQELFWTVWIRGSENTSRLRMGNWLPPALTNAEKGLEVAELQQAIAVMADDVAAQAVDDVEERAADRVAAAEWVGELKSAVTAMVSVLEELPDQFLGSDNVPLEEVRLGDDPFRPLDELGDKFPLILAEVPGLRWKMEPMRGLVRGL